MQHKGFRLYLSEGSDEYFFNRPQLDSNHGISQGDLRILTEK